MKCCECGKNNAKEMCNLCGSYWCKDCAEKGQGYCDCEVPPSIFPIKIKSKEKKDK